MRHSWPVRLQALLLALLLLGGGGRLPVVDGIVFHQQPGSVSQGAALLAADAVAPHAAADHLASGVPASGPAPRPSAAAHPVPLSGGEVQRVPSDAPPTRRPDPLARPRAPPLRA